MNKRISSDQTHLPKISSQKSGSPITQPFEGESPFNLKSPCYTPFDHLRHSFRLIWLCVMLAVYLSRKRLKEKFGREGSSARSRTQSAEMTHLPPFFAQDKTCCSKPGG